MRPASANDSIEFCIRFFRQLAATGLEHVVISPGSRSTPLTLAADTVGLAISMQIDERSGGFHALGLAKASRLPVALVSTSGTAAANYLPAVIEAAHTAVPLLVFTADRPPELAAWGAGQTIDQVGLFGSNPVWFFDAPVASEAPMGFASRLAARCWLEAASGPGGPVHVNFPFREPLIGMGGVPEIADDVPVAVAVPQREASPHEVEVLTRLVQGVERGVIVAGPSDGAFEGTSEIAALSRNAQWPIIAEPSSQLRCGPHVADGLVVAGADLLVRNEAIASLLRPEAVVMVGRSVTSMPVRRWLATAELRDVVVTGAGRDVADPDHLGTFYTETPGTILAGRVVAKTNEISSRGDWSTLWRIADEAGRKAAQGLLEGGFNEPAAVRAIAQHVPNEVPIYVSNSMPVRDLDLAWPVETLPRRFFSHRGAAGIDGLTSAAAGAAKALHSPVVLITGDLAFLHDMGGLMGAARDGVPLVVVVLDNAGGGIFAMLPVATAVERGDFDRLYTTPHGRDIPALARAAGLQCWQVDSLDALGAAVADTCQKGAASVIHATVDASQGHELRRTVAIAAGQAAEAALTG